MSISNEIREYATEYNRSYVFNYGELRACAARLDAETVELPKSADEKIWTGREMCFWTGATEGDWHDFNSLVYINGKWYVEDHDGQRYPAASVWYERPDSWERIADELEEWCVHAAGNCRIKLTDEDIVHDLAERIRKLADKGRLGMGKTSDEMRTIANFIECNIAKLPRYADGSTIRVGDMIYERWVQGMRDQNREIWTEDDKD